MTQEEKAKAYDKVSKEVKDFFEGKQKMYSDVTQTLEYLFPELKESEDEKIRKNLITCISTFKHPLFSERERKEFIVWLEKQEKRKIDVEQPSAWSEEDENEVAILEAYIRSNDWSESHIVSALGIVDELVKKLKSLRPQNRWKPSDKQLNALHDAAIYVDKSMFPYPKGTLMKLYKQLAKLREE